MTLPSSFQKTLLLSLLSLTLLQPGMALAERADREKPIALEADKMSVDDIERVQILEGNVVLTQGTLTIRSDKIVIKEDEYGFQHGTAYGGPNGLARLRQKKEGSDEWVEGEAERIEYNTRTEIAELFRRAWVKSGEDQLKGNYIWYNAVSERYLATAGGETTGGRPPRVRAVIHPKNATSSPAPTPENASQLRASPTLSPPDRN